MALNIHGTTAVTLAGQTSNGKGAMINSSPEGHLEVGIQGPVSAFGEVLSVEPVPIVQGDFVYGINPEIFFSITQGSGTATGTNGMAVMTAAAGASSLANLRSNHVLRYRPGQGMECRFTALWNAAAILDPVGASVTAGMGTSESGLFFGYVGGAGFSIVHNERNTREQQSATITTKSSNSQNATVTLAGVAYTVPVTNGASTTVTAYEIANFANYNASFPGWTAYSLGSVVYFVASSAGNQIGTFSITFPTSGVCSAFTEDVAGATTTTNLIAQTAWNRDVMDGSNSAANPSGALFDPAKLNVFKISMQYLGAGAIEFWMEIPNGKLQIVHRIERTNTSILPSLKNPGFPMQFSARNTTNTSAVGLSTASAAGFIQGAVKNGLGAQRSYMSDSLAISTTLTPLFSVRAARVFNGLASTAEIIPATLRITNYDTKALKVYLFENATLTTPNFSKLDATKSVAEIDTAATAISGGTQKGAVPVASGTNVLFDIHAIDGILQAGDTLTIAAQSVSTTTNALASLQWWEDQ